MVTKPFKFLAGALCLDFVNTVGAWTAEGILREKLRGPEDLERWTRQVPGRKGAEGKVTPKIFDRAIALRGALHGIFECAARKGVPAAEDLALLTRELAMARGHERVTYWRGGFHLRYEESPERVIWEIAGSAAALLTSGDLSRLRQCGGPDCGWMFLDTSRNRSRQWCDMKVCGNRVKARNFRERRGAYSERLRG